MVNFVLRNQTDVIFGRGTEKECGRLLRELGGTKVLVHHSGELFVLPLIEQIKRYLWEAGLEIVELSGVVPNPRIELVYEGIELCRRENVDCILAVGGGSVIDSAKGIAIGVPYDGDVWDFYECKCYPVKSIPLGVISTFAGTGSETTQASVVTRQRDHMKRSADDAPVIKPKFAIMNPELTCSIPKFQTASGIADITSHLMENFFSVSGYSDLADKMITAGLKCIIKNGLTVMKEPDNYDARAEVMMHSPWAINGVMKVGRQGDWASHALSHELSGQWDVAHGAALAVIFPAWMRYVYHVHPELFVKFSVNVFGIEQNFEVPEETILRGIDALEDFFHKLGLVTHLSELIEGEITDEVLHVMADRVQYGPEGTVGTVMPIRRQDSYEIFKLCL